MRIGRASKKCSYRNQCNCMLKGKQKRVFDQTCSCGCGRPRRNNGRYSQFCHRQRQRIDRDAKLTNAEILARGIRNLGRMLRKMRN